MRDNDINKIIKKAEAKRALLWIVVLPRNYCSEMKLYFKQDLERWKEKWMELYNEDDFSCETIFPL